MKIYIAGKIAGDRRYRAKFREAAKSLEAAGHVVLNPATLPDGLTDGDYMRIALAMLDASDLAVFLPDYQESRGAMCGYREPGHVVDKLVREKMLELNGGKRHERNEN